MYLGGQWSSRLIVLARLRRQRQRRSGKITAILLKITAKVCPL